jgi:hypothetical protein
MSKLSTVVAQGKSIMARKAYDLFDKSLLFAGGSIGRQFSLVKGYYG